MSSRVAYDELESLSSNRHVYDRSYSALGNAGYLQVTGVHGMMTFLFVLMSSIPGWPSWYMDFVGRCIHSIVAWVGAMR